MIIIYDDDERIAAPAGKLFVERGVENVYVLTGGCEHLALTRRVEF